MWIAPGEFSAETENVLKLFEDELQFYDISLDKSARYQKVSIWTCRDGIWQESGRICGEIAEDFRNLPCSSGTAVTYTVSEQPLE